VSFLRYLSSPHQPTFEPKAPEREALSPNWSAFMTHERPEDDERDACAAHEPKEGDAWESATFEGNRIRQHRAFHALSFREKILRIEQMNEVAEALRRGRRAPTDEHPVPDSDPS